MSDRAGGPQATMRRWGLPVDLLGIVAAVVATGIVVFAPLLRTSPLRIGVGLAFVLFVPGYAFVAALFPERASQTAEAEGESVAASASNSDPESASTAAASDSAPDEGSDTASASDPDSAPTSGIDGLERVVLSFGSSIALVPLVGLVLNFTPWGIRLVPIFLSLAGLTLGLTALAAIRRRRLPPSQQFRVPTGWIGQLRAELLEPDGRVDLALNVVLVVSVLLALSSVGYAVAGPTQGEAFTEFSLLTENETGALVADEYPTNFTAGESQSLVVSVTNQEHEPVQYTVVVELQRVTVRNGSVVVQAANRLHRFTPWVQVGETWRRHHQITPSMTGDRLRLEYRLYRGAPPIKSTAEPYRSLHLWVSVGNATAG